MFKWYALPEEVQEKILDMIVSATQPFGEQWSNDPADRVSQVKFWYNYNYN